MKKFTDLLDAYLEANNEYKNIREQYTGYESCYIDISNHWVVEKLYKAAEELNKAFNKSDESAQAQVNVQEPIAWMCSDELLVRSGYFRFSKTRSGAWNIPVYTTPTSTPYHQSLTEEEIIEIAKVTKSAEPGQDGYILPVTFARAIEDAYKAKNGIAKEKS
jgi:hypothetical protein